MNDKKMRVEKVNLVSIDNNINNKLPRQNNVGSESSKQNKSFEKFLQEAIAQKEEKEKNNEENVLYKRR